MSRAPDHSPSAAMIAAAKAAHAAGDDPMAAMADALAEFAAENVRLAERAGLFGAARQAERSAETMQHLALRRRGKLN